MSVHYKPFHPSLGLNFEWRTRFLISFIYVYWWRYSSCGHWWGLWHLCELWIGGVGRSMRATQKWPHRWHWFSTRCDFTFFVIGNYPWYRYACRQDARNFGSIFLPIFPKRPIFRDIITIFVHLRKYRFKIRNIEFNTVDPVQLMKKEELSTWRVQFELYLQISFFCIMSSCSEYKLFILCLHQTHAGLVLSIISW